MTTRRIAPDHSLVQDIKKLDPDVIAWVPHALTILDSIDARDAYDLSDFATMCGVKVQDPLMIIAAGVLSSWRDAVLDVRFHLLHNGERAYIDPNMMPAILRDEDITHPTTGKIVSNPTEHCYLSYKLRDGL